MSIVSPSKILLISLMWLLTLPLGVWTSKNVARTPCLCVLASQPIKPMARTLSSWGEWGPGNLHFVGRSGHSCSCMQTQELWISHGLVVVGEQEWARSPYLEGGEPINFVTS